MTISTHDIYGVNNRKGKPKRLVLFWPRIYRWPFREAKKPSCNTPKLAGHLDKRRPADILYPVFANPVGNDILCSSNTFEGFSHRHLRCGGSREKEGWREHPSVMDFHSFSASRVSIKCRVSCPVNGKSKVKKVRKPCRRTEVLSYDMQQRTS